MLFSVVNVMNTARERARGWGCEGTRLPDGTAARLVL
jgi:hypothetical protein